MNSQGRFCFRNVFAFAIFILLIVVSVAIPRLSLAAGCCSCCSPSVDCTTSADEETCFDYCRVEYGFTCAMAFVFHEDGTCDGTSCEATYINLISFTATIVGASQVEIAWQTASEVNNIGFNVWRSGTRDGDYVQINTARIPANGNEAIGAIYEIADTDCPSGNCFYKLEDIDVDLVSTFHGPIEVDKSLPACGTSLPGGLNLALILLPLLAATVHLLRKTKAGKPR